MKSLLAELNMRYFNSANGFDYLLLYTFLHLCFLSPEIVRRAGSYVSLPVYSCAGCLSSISSTEYCTV